MRKAVSKINIRIFRYCIHLNFYSDKSVHMPSDFKAEAYEMITQNYVF